MTETLLNNQTDTLIEIWHQLMQIHKNKNLDKKFSNFSKLSLNEISIIKIVSQNEEVILGDICKTLNIPKSTLTNTINRLEKKGYLHRKISQKDLRSYGLYLTEKGNEVHKEHQKYETLIFKYILKSLNTDIERTQFLNLLKIIVSNSAKEDIL